MPKALIVEDEPLMREYLWKNLGRIHSAWKALACAKDGLEAIEKVKQDNFDIIIMDIMMPKMDGYTACREIKKIKDIPFIMLSARGEEYDKLIGFDLGIDDYVTKPFSPKELVARIKAVTKRKDNKEDVYEIKGIKLDNVAHDVYIDGKKIYLTPKEYERHTLKKVV